MLVPGATAATAGGAEAPTDGAALPRRGQIGG